MSKSREDLIAEGRQVGRTIHPNLVRHRSRRGNRWRTQEEALIKRRIIDLAIMQHARKVASEVYRESIESAAAFWLPVLEEELASTKDDLWKPHLQDQIKRLHRMLKTKPSIETIRVQTRERVRRHRAARKSTEGLPGQ
jgi:hypothetical protein